MSRLSDLLNQVSLENDIKNIIEKFKASSRVSEMMNPSLVDYDRTLQKITIEFPVQDFQLNEHDTMHAGFIAAAFDESFGVMAAYLGQGNDNVSINISLNCIKPIPMGDFIQITVKPTSLGKKILTLAGECHLSSNGLLTNTAIATFAIVG